MASVVTTSHVASWGVTGGAVGSVSGIVTDIDVSTSAQMSPEYNELGQVVGQTLYDEQTTVTATILVDVDEAPPLSGASISIAGKTLYVRDTEIIESNRDYRKIRVTAEKYKRTVTVTDVTASSSGAK